MHITSKNRQTLSDIAIQMYGEVSVALLLARENDISPTIELQPGQSIFCPETTTQSYTQKWVQAQQLTPATEVMDMDEVQVRVFSRAFTHEFI